MGRPRVHDDATAETLLAVASDLLYAEGMESLSVRRVADAAGTSHRAVYALFGSKRGLLDALAAFGYDDLAGRVSRLEATSDPAADLVRAGTVAFRRFASSRPALFRLAFEEISPEAVEQPRVAHAALASYRALAAWFTRLREAGLVHPARTDADCIFAFHATCHGLAASERAAKPPPEGPGFWRVTGPSVFDAVWTDTLASVVRGFALPPEPTAGAG
ncbi:MAG: TetR/AcrR family transcriptional regulator [Intrasporangium sp.]|uniref:TetR/AcrR family transcriptional regulator n=1 Tax=Intrasporangium sp. TaxID=1925024 RepID=UPI0026473897|nr:TetR/AcrR family transcriptional regulator [Intrasporangium sp.]MDN5797756.1 TetR/AcrR family transcriptional regulator [Intrasporangium sp.]